MSTNFKLIAGVTGGIVGIVGWAAGVFGLVGIVVPRMGDGPGEVDLGSDDDEPIIQAIAA